MKILVAYASAGAGHRKAAEAVVDYIRVQSPQTQVTLFDVLDKTNPVYRFLYVSGYGFLITRGAWLWRALFYLTYARRLRRPLRSGARVADRISTLSVLQHFREENPDYIVSTHFLASECAALLKRAQAITSTLITVITDFGVHPFWISRGTDSYVVASETTKLRLEKLGIERSRISVHGIPVQAAFTVPAAKSAARERLKLDPKRFTALLVTGSFGIGPLEKITEELAGEVQLIVVCARNEQLRRRLEGKKYPGVFVRGFVDNMPELMAASDVIITKPGGLTIAEVLAMELPPLFISPIPGQEIQNIKVLNGYGIGRSCSTPREVRICVREYKRHPERVEDVRMFMRALKKPWAAKGIWDAICEGCLRSAG